MEGDTRWEQSTVVDIIQDTFFHFLGSTFAFLGVKKGTIMLNSLRSSMQSRDVRHQQAGIDKNN